MPHICPIVRFTASSLLRWMSEHDGRKVIRTFKAKSALFRFIRNATMVIREGGRIWFSSEIGGHVGESANVDVTGILRRASRGSDSAVKRLMPLVYDELRALAESYLQHERADHTLQATALVHEAYVRLIKQDGIDWQNRAHFFGVAAQMIRRVLVDHARHHDRVKRGGGRQRVRIEEGIALLPQSDLDLLALDEAMDKLADFHERAARIVELRFFGGLSREEVAEVLGISLRTVGDDWRLALAWLRRELGDDTRA